MVTRRENETTLLHRFKDGRPFAFAGIGERWEKQVPTLETCALITTVSNACVAPIHDRMPVILPEQSYASWLSNSLNNLMYLSGLLEPCQAEEMEAIPISSFVNDPRHEDPRCIF